jgi:hypothetical protein
MTTVQPTTDARQIIRIAAVNDGIVTRTEEGVAAAAVLVPSIPQKVALNSQYSKLLKRHGTKALLLLIVAREMVATPTSSICRQHAFLWCRAGRLVIFISALTRTLVARLSPMTTNTL